MSGPLPRLAFVLGSLALPGLARPVSAQSVALGLASNGRLCSDQGRAVARFHAILNSLADAPAIDGWALGVRAVDGAIVALSLEGTAGEPALADGFVYNEITTGEDNEGAVSFVALSTSGARALPAGQRHRLLTVDVESTTGTSAALRYADGLRSGAGVVSNIVQAAGRAIVPAVPAAPALASAIPGPSVGFALSGSPSAEPYNGIVGGRDAAGEVLVPLDPVRGAEAHVFPAYVIEDERARVNGWTVVVEVEGDVELLDVTEKGTISDGWAQWVLARVVEPEVNDGRRGIIATTAITDAFIPGHVLGVGTYPLFDIHLAARMPACKQGCSARLFHADGLRIRNSPGADNQAVVDWRTVAPCGLETAAVTLRFSRATGSFLRGNSNGDARLDIADAIFLLHELFAGGPESRCRDGEDANADGRIDLSDPITVLHFLFHGERPPSAPFPACGAGSLEPGGLGCLLAHAACADAG